MASLDFPRDPNRDGGITHPMNPYESHVWTARRMAPSASPLKLAEALLVMAARAGPGQAKIDEAGCVFFQTDLNKNWSSSNNGFTRQNDATSGCKQQKRSFFFWIYPTRIIGWTQSIPKQHWSAPSSIHPQLPLPGGGAGRAKKSADGCLLFIAGWKGQEKGSGQTGVMWIYLNLFYRVATCL